MFLSPGSYCIENNRTTFPLTSSDTSRVKWTSVSALHAEFQMKLLQEKQPVNELNLVMLTSLVQCND
jgi:hypothetical protein